MKHLKDLLILGFGVSLLLMSCSGSTTATLTGNWVKRTEFDGVARTNAIAFVIGNFAYIGTGYDGQNRLNDFWVYDANLNYWTQKASLPANGGNYTVQPNGLYGRSSAVGFAVDSLGFISTGYDGYNRLNDTWSYSPTTNSWKQRANFAGTARYDAVGFSVSHLGYVSCGFDGNYDKDLWEYTPTTDTWVQRPSLGGQKRSGAVAFVYNNNAYVCTGINNNVECQDFWMFSGSTKTWTQLRDIANTSSDSYDDDYTDIVRDHAVAFVMNNSQNVPKAYITVGQNGSYLLKTWEYDFATDLWTRKTPYERSGRAGAVAFTVLGRGFVGTGKNSTLQLDDFDEWQPDAAYNAND
jgi:N-acetylneuraminic acid mutarotase